jgi:cytosol alanyl aminopeptidase
MRSSRLLLVAVVLAAGSCRGEAPVTGSSAPSAPSRAARTDTPRPPDLRLPAIAAPRRQSIDLTIVPEQDTFTGEVAIDIDVRQPTSILWLNAKEIEVREASIEAGGARQTATRVPARSDEFLGLSVPRAIGPGPAVVRIAYRGRLVDDDYIGLFRQREGGAAYVFSQFEIGDARRAFPCFDEPAFRIPWQLTLRVAKEDVALANTLVARESDGPADGMKTVEFRPTPPLSSYLVALAVGPFELVTVGKAGARHVPLRVAVPRGHAGETRAARRSTREFLVELERYFGTPYPFEKLDSVAVPHFFGAMENAALITYASDVLLARPGDDRRPDFLSHHREDVAHETAHQWFGDLVTMTWWDDLWLNESFATWLERKLTSRTHSDADLGDGLTDREGAMRADSRPSTRAIHGPVNHRDDFLFLFDPINYGKGAAVIAMFERWVGEDAFRAGVRSYLREHQWKNATSADFLAALDRAAPGREMAAAFTTFLDQPGVPLVSMELACRAGQPPALELRQERLLPASEHRRPSAQRWKIPVCVEFGTGARATTQCTLVDRPSQRLELKGAGSRCPTWINGNADAVGYYRVSYGGDLLARFVDGRAPVSPRERIAALEDAIALADAGRLSYGVLMASLPALAREKDFSILRRAVRLAGAIEDLVPPERRDEYAGLVRSLFGARARALGWKPRAGEPVAARLVRPALLGLVAIEGRDAALAAEAERLARAWLRDPSTLPSDMASAVLAVAAAARGGAELYDAYVARLRQEKVLERRSPIVGALARFRDPSLVARTVQLAASAEIPFNEMGDLLSGGRMDPALAEKVYDEAVRRFAPLVRKLGADRRIELLHIGDALCSSRRRDQADRFFADKLAGAPGIAMARGKMREEIDLCVARRAAQSAAVGQALAGG